MNKLIIGFIVFVLVAVFAGLFFSEPQDSTEQASQMASSTDASNLETIASVAYYCDDKKIIQATYKDTEDSQSTAAVPGQSPQPTGRVELELSDGRVFDLSQTISGSGVRYANETEKFVFWNKGSQTQVLENNETSDFKNCIEVMADPGGLPLVYANGLAGFSLRYPTGYAVSMFNQEETVAQEQLIKGVKFTVDSKLASSTNLSADTYLSVETMASTTNCSAADFLTTQNENSIINDGREYSVASSSDAGAGNRYEQWVYALPGSSPCLAVRYFIHYSVFENYSAGTVKEFDKTALLNTLDKIRNSLVID